MRTIGKVKWFDAAKGEGCVLSDGGTQAALTRATLEPFGLTTIDAGVALVYDVKLETGRLIAGTIHEIAGQGPGAARKQPPSANAPLRVKGCVQWFNSEKGYGFIVSDSVVGDVLLHRSVLDAIGVESLREGAVLDCDVVPKVKGLQVQHIHAVLGLDVPLPPPLTGASIVIGGSGGRAIDLRGQARRINWFSPSPSFGSFNTGGDAGVWEDAVCKWFSRPKGFGFVRLVDDDEDVFVHMDTLRRCGMRELRLGQRVRVRVNDGERGLTATAVEPEEDGDDD